MSRNPSLDIQSPITSLKDESRYTEPLIYMFRVIQISTLVGAAAAFCKSELIYGVGQLIAASPYLKISTVWITITEASFPAV